ncbi:MAG: hypothetical protein K6E85_15270 [Lachnospiraceae bacterium]|nr:hypothetical protein [Lachnospiraceae bacterium]
MSINFQCPACGKKLFSYEPRYRKYGKIIHECKKCGANYLDPRYHELAIDGIPENEFQLFPYIFMLVIGALITWRGWHLLSVKQLGVPDALQWLLPVVFLIIGAALFIGAIIGIILIKTGCKRKKFEKELEGSKIRMKDMRYTNELQRLGYDVPAEYRNPII